MPAILFCGLLMATAHPDYFYFAPPCCEPPMVQVAPWPNPRPCIRYIQDVPEGACIPWDFPPRFMSIPAGGIAGLPTRSLHEQELRERRRLDREIEYVKAEMAGWNKRLSDLENPSRFLYSYAFSMDNEQAKLALHRAKIKLEELEEARRDLIDQQSRSKKAAPAVPSKPVETLPQPTASYRQK